MYPLPSKIHWMRKEVNLYYIPSDCLLLSFFVFFEGGSAYITYCLSFFFLLFVSIAPPNFHSTMSFGPIGFCQEKEKCVYVCVRHYLHDPSADADRKTLTNFPPRQR
jgi:hypothetical protein